MPGPGGYLPWGELPRGESGAEGTGVALLCTYLTIIPTRCTLDSHNTTAALRGLALHHLPAPAVSAPGDLTNACNERRAPALARPQNPGAATSAPRRGPLRRRAMMVRSTRRSPFSVSPARWRDMGPQAADSAPERGMTPSQPQWRRPAWESPGRHWPPRVEKWHRPRLCQLSGARGGGLGFLVGVWISNNRRQGSHTSRPQFHTTPSPSRPGGAVLNRRRPCCPVPEPGSVSPSPSLLPSAFPLSLRPPGSRCCYSVRRHHRTTPEPHAAPSAGPAEPTSRTANKGQGETARRDGALAHHLGAPVQADLRLVAADAAAALLGQHLTTARRRQHRDAAVAVAVARAP